MWATGRARRCYSRWEVTPAGATCVGVLLAGGGIPLLPARAVGGGVDGPSLYSGRDGIGGAGARWGPEIMAARRRRGRKGGRVAAERRRARMERTEEVKDALTGHIETLAGIRPIPPIEPRPTLHSAVSPRFATPNAS